MLGTEDIVGIVGRVAYAGIHDPLLDDTYDQLEDLDFWKDNEEEGEDFWVDKDFSWDFYDKDEKQAAKVATQVTPGSSAQFRAFEEATDYTTPRRWMAEYENGKIPLEAMTEVAEGHYLRPDVAKAVKRMQRAARRDGVTLTFTDTYRSYDVQVRLAEEKGLYHKGGLAAEPGTSLHGWGIAIDFGEGVQRDWLSKNAPRFGFKTIPREPWHWEWDGSVEPGETAFREKPRRKRPKPAMHRPRPGKAGTVSAVEGVGYAPEFSSLTALPGAVLGLLSEPLRPVSTRNTKATKATKAAGGGGSKVPAFVPKREHDFFIAAAKATGLPVRLLAFVARAESDFGPNKSTISSAGAIGRMQLMPGTAQELGVDPYNLRQNIMGGARYLAQMLTRWKGDLRKALASYNAGPNNYEAGLGYADDILSALRSR